MHQRLRPAALLIAVSVALGGCGESHVEQNAFAWTGTVPAGSWFYLRNRTGTIRVERSTSPSIEVTATAHWRSGRRNPVRFARGTADGNVIICTMLADGGTCSPRDYSTGAQRHWWRIFGSSSSSDARVDYVVHVPAGVKLDVSNIVGSVHVDGADAAVIAHTINGTVHASTTHGPVVLSSVNGSIFAHVDTLADSGAISATTVNGSVTAELPPQLDGNVDASTVNGHITIDYPLTRTGETSSRHVSAMLGAGGREIRMGTVNGSVTLKKIQS